MGSERSSIAGNARIRERRARLVAIDVDGTLIEGGQPVAPKVKHAIWRAQERGAIVTLATGRMFPLVAAIVRDLELTAPVICYGGAMIVDSGSGQPIFEKGVPLALTHEVIQEARRRHLTARAYVGTSVYVDRIEPDSYNEESLRKVNAVEVGDLLTFLTRDPSHLAIDAPAQQTRPLVETMRVAFSGRLNVTTGHPLLTEFSHPTVHKGSALVWLCDFLGVPIGDSLAIGDDWNDIEMLRQAGVSVAVATAHPDVLAIARYVVPGVGEGGVAVALERYAL